MGQKISVKFFGRDPVSGQIRLSRRALQETTGRIIDLEGATSMQNQLIRQRTSSVDSEQPEKSE